MCVYHLLFLVTLWKALILLRRSQAWDSCRVTLRLFQSASCGTMCRLDSSEIFFVIRCPKSTRLGLEAGSPHSTNTLGELQSEVR